MFVLYFEYIDVFNKTDLIFGICLASLDEDENKTESIDYRMKNPYVIIFGLSKYHDQKIAPFTSSIGNCKMMKDLFKNNFGYKYIEKSFKKTRFC